LLNGAISGGVGIDPDAPTSDDGAFRFVKGHYPDDYEHDGEPFDVIVGTCCPRTPDAEEQNAIAAACFRHLRPEGRLVMTVPSRFVDPILHVIQSVGLSERDTVHLEEHHGFHAVDTTPLFEKAWFTLTLQRHFELVLNNLFVFTKPAVA
jgi:hypothetical protein